MNSEEIILNTYSGHVTLKEMKIADSYVKAMGIVKGEWFSAFALFECSLERIVEFIQHLDQLIRGDLNTECFVNESGNFELNISLDKTTGHAEINGIIMRSLNEGSKLKFSLDSDMISVERFYESFERVIKS